MGTLNKISTGERLEFYNYGDVTVEHLHRYAIALDFIKNKKVLDIASGEGYGSFLLSSKAELVYGVDIDATSIKNATLKYKNHNLKFIEGAAAKIPLENNSVDVVVSFETIEHHDQHDEMMLEIKRVLTSDGILIMSSPDKEYYSDKTGQKNKFHIKELYLQEFKDLISKYFEEAFFLYQKSYNLNSFVADEQFYYIDLYYGDNLGISKKIYEPLYNIVIASDLKQYPIKPSFFNGENISKLVLESNKIKIRDSTSYRIGNLIVKPFFELKKTIKILLNKKD
ncbi:MAG TPA: class I SAM-dependent methyltransferase [Flavobacterium sp.]|jgi:ubiquinone/menaquinone biosynthesis C-methylase UbiE